MRVLIVTEPDDIHAALVKLALEQKGVECALFFSADMPAKQKNTIQISSEKCSWHSKDHASEASCHYDDGLNAIWWRRPRRPDVPDTVHAEDKMFVRKENAVYHDSLPFLLDKNAWWVNPIASHAKTRSKIVQLKLAQQCGFKLPDTLISNAPEDIKHFINVKKSTIYKPFYPQFWAEDDGMRILYTNKISLEDLPADPLLQVVPGIYQEYIEKKYELRVTCFGSRLSAIKIDSQNHSLGQTDWRKIPGAELALSEIELPQMIRNKIILFMKKIGVVFGCFDFIVTPDDEIIFLELNEQGQFLWVEEHLPQLCYLDQFAEFIMQQAFYFPWKKTKRAVQAADLDANALEIVKANMQNHVYLNQIKKVA